MTWLFTGWTLLKNMKLECLMYGLEVTATQGLRRHFPSCNNKRLFNLFIIFISRGGLTKLIQYTDRKVLLLTGLILCCQLANSQQSVRLIDNWAFLKQDLGGIWEAVRPVKA